jgi:hypothetical protein
MISWWSKHVGMILIVLMCDAWINVLLQTNALIGPLQIFPQNFTFVETFNRFLAVYVMRYLRPMFQEAPHSNLRRTLPVSYTVHFRVLLPTNGTQKRTFSFAFSDKTFVWISKFPNAQLQWPIAVNNRGRFQVVRDAVQDASPRECKAQRHSVTSTRILSNTKLNAFHASWFPLGKFVSLMWGSSKICWDFFVCFADPWKLLL